MSDFSDFMEEGFDDSADTFGPTTATLEFPGKLIVLHGILDMLKADRSLAMGGEEINALATFMVSRNQFSAIAPPLERALEGKKLTLETRKYRIVAAAVDEVCVTLTLDDAARK